MLPPIERARGAQIYLLGRFEVEWRGRTLHAADWNRQKAATLLQRLALERNWLRDQAIEELWPEAEPASGANSLHQTLHLLRRLLDDSLGRGGAAALFSLTNGVLRLRPEVWVDVEAFERSVGAAESIDELRAALSLYLGELLPEERYAGWTDQPRESLRRLQREGNLRLAARLIDANEFVAGTELLHPLLADDSADERVHRELMRLYALSGRRHSALRQYQACRSKLQEELGLEPDPETEALYQAIVEGRLARVEASRASERRRPPPEVERGAPLVGRREELAKLRAVVAGARGETLLIAGEAGIGKTRLAIEGLALAETTGSAILRGTAYEQEGKPSYACIAEALDHHLGDDTGDEHPINHYRPLGVTDPQQEHAALFRATLEFLRRIRSRGPVTLLLDDLHAADDASLALFHFLARRSREERLTIVATYRSETRGGVSAFSTLLHALYRERVAETIELWPLSREDAAEMMAQVLGGKPDRAFAESVFAVAEGNPFFTDEITRAVLGEGAVVEENGIRKLRPDTRLPIPAGLRELLRVRVSRLGPDAVTALSAAAVLGREFTFAILREVVSLSDPTLLGTLEAALQGRILEDTGDAYRFRHSLIRQTLYRGLSSGHKAWLHRQVAEALLGSQRQGRATATAHAEGLAFHLERSDRREMAIPYLIQAGEKAAAIYAIEIADDYFRRALALLDDLQLTDDPLRWSLLLALGWWGLILANAPTAVACVERALALPMDGDWHPGAEALLRAHRIAARSLITAGRMDEAGLHLASAGELLPDNESVDAADYLYDMSLWHWHRDEHDEAYGAARRSLAVAESLADRAAIARALEILALAQHALGEWQAGLAAEARRSSLAAENRDVVELFDIHLCLWEYRLFGDSHYTDLRGRVEATLEQARRMGAVRAVALCHCFLGALEFQAGRWSRAEGVLRSGMALYRRIGAAAGEAHCCHRLAILETARGNAEAGLSLIADGISAAERSLLRSHCLTRLYSALIHNRLQAGDLPAAGRALEIALAVGERHGGCNTCDSLLLPAAVRVRLAQGRVPAAERFCRELDAAASRYGSPLWLATASQAQGAVASATGRLDGALAHFEDACRGFRLARFEYALATSLGELADVLARREAAGSASDARERRREAEEILLRLRLS